MINRQAQEQLCRESGMIRYLYLATKETTSLLLEQVRPITSIYTYEVPGSCYTHEEKLHPDSYEVLYICTYERHLHLRCTVVHLLGTPNTNTGDATEKYNRGF